MNYLMHQRMLTVRNIINAVQVSVAFLIVHVLSLSLHDF